MGVRDGEEEGVEVAVALHPVELHPIDREVERVEPFGVVVPGQRDEDDVRRRRLRRFTEADLRFSCLTEPQPVTGTRQPERGVHDRDLVEALFAQVCQPLPLETLNERSTVHRVPRQVPVCTERLVRTFRLVCSEAARPFARQDIDGDDHADRLYENCHA